MKRLISIASISVLAVSVLVLVQCDDILVPGEPRNVELEAATSTTVKITWDAPTEGTPDNYVVYFDVTATDNGYEIIGEPTATEFTHDPAGKTGMYKVAAKFGDDVEDAAATPSTLPKHTAVTALGELNSAELAGYGWDRTLWTGAKYTMTQAGSAANVDMYLTDWAGGYTGPDYSVASPDQAPSDPGGVTPAGSWRVNGFSNALTSETDPLPEHSSSTYFNFTDLTTDPLMLGCYTADGYYVLVKFSGKNVTNGTWQVETWFQSVEGLRLIQH